MNPEQMVAEALKQKDDRAVFEQLALGALNHHECDPEFQRLLLHSALEGHELAEMFFEKFILRVYALLGGYITERQRDGAMVKIDPLIVSALLHRHDHSPLPQQQFVGLESAPADNLQRRRSKALHQHSPAWNKHRRRSEA